MTANGDTLEICWGGQVLTLSAHKAIYWAAERSWLLADPHFGKDCAFRQSGVPVPAGTTVSDLGRLKQLVEAAETRRLIILGDFFHSAAARSETTLHLLDTWFREQRGLETVLVRGNHDRHAGDPPAEWRIRCVAQPWRLGLFELWHHATDAYRDGDGYSMGGHVHPAVRLRGTADCGLRLPCFHFKERAAVLPAFGGFTGTAEIRWDDQDRIYAIHEGRLFDIRR